MNHIDALLRFVPNSSDTSMWMSRRWHADISFKFRNKRFECALFRWVSCKRNAQSVREISREYESKKYNLHPWRFEMAKKMKRVSADQTRCFVEKIVFNNILLPRLLDVDTWTAPVKTVLLLQPFQPVVSRCNSRIWRLKICCLKLWSVDAGLSDARPQTWTCNASISRTLRRMASSALPRRSSMRLNFNMSWAWIGNDQRKAGDECKWKIVVLQNRTHLCSRQLMATWIHFDNVR